MTTEFVLLLSIFAFLILGVFVSGPAAPRQVFATGGPHLAARIEEQLSTGRQFKPMNGGQTNAYIAPQAAAPTASF